MQNQLLQPKSTIFSTFFGGGAVRVVRMTEIPTGLENEPTINPSAYVCLSQLKLDRQYDSFQKHILVCPAESKNGT